MYLLKRLANITFIVLLKCLTKTSVSLNAKIPPNLFLHLLRNRRFSVKIGSAIVGRGVTLSDGVKIYYNPEIFGNVSIGRFTSISGPSTRICANVNKVEIGAFCSIASNVVIQEYYHNSQKATTYNIFTNLIHDYSIKDQTISKGRIIIEDDVWIGSNSVILSGVTIGRGAIIGAGSIVTKDVGKYQVFGGNPAKYIKHRFSGSTIQELEMSRWWEWPTEKIIESKDFFTRNRI